MEFESPLQSREIPEITYICSALANAPAEVAKLVDALL